MATTKATPIQQPSRVHRAGAKPAQVVELLIPADRFHVKTTLRAKKSVSKPTGNKELVRDLASMLLATTEAIEHYAQGERRDDPIVKAHVAVAKKARTLLKKITKAKAA